MAPMATDTPIPNVGIILTHNRPELLAQCVAAAGPQFDLIIVIDNASEPPVDATQLRSRYAGDGAKLLVLPIADQPPNISKFWRAGLDAATFPAFLMTGLDDPTAAQWNVALVCDDVILPDNWVHLVATGLREYGAAAACTHAITPATQPLIKAAPDSDIMNRMTPHAFMIAGENEAIRPDERLPWWWGDTHMDWTARKHGGMVILPGPVAVNSQPNHFTVLRPELAEQAGKDGETFVSIWGFRPW